MDRSARIDRFLAGLKKDKVFQHNIEEHAWLSGAATTVYPITVGIKDITLQWKSDRQIFDKFIKRIETKNSDLIKYGYFYKSDGSCPSSIVFMLTDTYCI